MTLEELYRDTPENIDIDYFIFSHTESLSAQIGDGFVVAVDPTKVRSEADEKVKVAHEVGHCSTLSFYSPGEDFVVRQRCENRADWWAVKKLVPLDELAAAVSAGYCEPWQLAEYFDVPEQFLVKAVAFYRAKQPDFRL